MHLLPIVEGDGDLEAVPELVRRVLTDHGRHDVKVCRAHKRGELPKVLSRFDDYLRAALLEEAPILWVMDYDCEECNDHLQHTQGLRQRVAESDSSQRVEFVFMVQEFETLFLADHETSRRVFPDISVDLKFPVNPELVRNAKGALSKARPKGFAYKPTQHQKKLTAQLDLGRLRDRSDSFRRFEAALLRLI